MQILTGQEAEKTLKQIVDGHTKKEYPAPYIAGYFKDGQVFAAFDNTTRDCWVETFKDEATAIRWCKGEIEKGDN